MRLRVTAVVLSLFSSVAGTCVSASFAAEPTVNERVVVTATRLPDVDVPIDDLPAATTVFTRADIESLGARSVQDVLATAAGATVFDQIGNGFQTTFDLRGFSAGSGCAVYLDGTRINDPRNNSVSLETVPIDAVDRIEITRGSSAAIAGGGSEAGVVQIWTRRGGENGGSVSVAGGGGTSRASAEARGTRGHFDGSVAASYDKSDAFRVNAGGDARRFAASGGVVLGRGRLQLSLDASDTGYGAPGALTADEFKADPGQNKYNLLDRADGKTKQAALNWRGALNGAWSLASNLSWRDTSETSLSTGRAAAAGFGGFRLDAEGSANALTAQITHEKTFGKATHRFVAGVEGLDGSTDASGWFTDPADPASYDPAAPSSKNTTGRRTLGVFVQEFFNPGARWSLSAGARWDHDRSSYREVIPDATLRDAKAFSETSLRAGAVFHPKPVADLYVSYGEAFLPPTAEELFAFPLFGSNPALKPEDARSYEAGARLRLGGVTGSAALFRIDTRDEIVFDPDSTLGPFGANVNAGRTRRDGVEIEVRAGAAKRLSGFVNASLTDATFRNGADSGKRVPLVPRARASAGIDARFEHGFGAHVDATWVGSQVLDNDGANAQSRLDPYTVVNARASWSPRAAWTFFVEARNLFDRVYATRGIFAFDFASSTDAVFLTPAPGRRVLAGATWRF